MTREDIRAAILAAIDTIAPGSVPENLDGDADIREAMDLDSMDILNVAAALHSKLGVDIPESELNQITTLNGAVGYLERRLGSG